MSAVTKAITRCKPGKRQTLSTLEERMVVADSDRTGTLTVKNVVSILTKSGVKFRGADDAIKSLGEAMDYEGDGSFQYKIFVEELKDGEGGGGTGGGGREEWYEREKGLADRLRKKVKGLMGKGGGKGWQKKLRGR